MTPARPWCAVLAIAAAAASCRPSGPPPAIPVELAACVPPGALLLAGANLDSLRASPLYRRLPGAARTFLEPLRDASGLLLVYTGAEILLISQGHFREAAPGATLAGPHLMLSGSPALTQAALAQRRSGASGSPDLFAQASAAAAGHAVWIASRGKVNLPLSGDAANLNRFLRLADFATVGLRIDAPMRLDAAAQCATPDAARHLEESLRGFLSLAVLGVSRQPQLAAMLRAVDVRSEGSAVHASLIAPAEDLPQLLDFFAR
jgi:hypothetical protein